LINQQYIRFIPWIGFILISIPLFFLFSSLGLLYQILISGFSGVVIFGLITFLLQSFLKSPEDLNKSAKRLERQNKAKDAFDKAFQTGLDSVIVSEAMKAGKEAGEKFGRARVQEIAQLLSPSGNSRGKLLAEKLGKGLMQAGKNASENLARGNSGITFRNPLESIEKDYNNFNNKRNNKKKSE